MTTYCEYVILHPDDAYNRIYHDTQYGFPLRDDNALFERLMLEINQAGLSWITILKKADAFHAAFPPTTTYAMPSVPSNRRAIRDRTPASNNDGPPATIAAGTKCRGRRETPCFS